MKQFIKDLALAKDWSKKSFHYLPWRRHRSLYHTLISEVMLQQTTVTTVMNRFEQFIAAFPNLHSLAQGEEAELLKLWQGLGYYNRAKRLKLAAKRLSEMDLEKLCVETLLDVPGIGNYTANALMAIGLEQRAFAIDVNLERVLIRYFGYKHLPNVKKTVRENLQFWLESEFQKRVLDFRAMHESLMDVGRVYCQARKRSCLQCPLRKGCQSFANNNDFHNELLLSEGKNNKKKKSSKEVADLARLVIIKNKKILLVQRQKDQWLNGQWEVPTFVIKGEVPEKQYVKKTLKLGKKIQKIIPSTITKYQFNNLVYYFDQNFSEVAQIPFARWFRLNGLDHLPLTSVTIKILKLGIKKNQEEHKPDSVLQLSFI